MSFQKVEYSSLNARQRENYNFHKVSAILADYGFTTMRLSDDWQGADFIAVHINGELFLKIQLKGRLTIGKKYLEKEIHVCFPYEGKWYLYPHDEVVLYLLGTTNIGRTKSWGEEGLYSFKKISTAVLNHLQRYAL